jgi:hypothetical protein
MTTRRNHTRDAFDDVEKPYPTVTDGPVGDGAVRPLVVRLGDLWNDFLRAPEESDPAAPPRPASGVPLIDDMRGIVQWD